MICKTNIPIIKITSGGGGGGYVRAMGVPNGEDIIANAPDFEVEGVVYKPIYYLALRDTFITETFSKTGTGVSTGADAFVFSDEPTTLYIGDTTHTFDTTKDFATSEEWKCRYVICYATAENKAITTSVFLYLSTNVFEFIGASGTTFSYNSRIFGHNATNYANIEYVNIENSAIINNKIKGNYFLANCLRLITVKLPEITEIASTYFMYECNQLQEISIPKLETITDNYALYGCRALREINLSDLVTITGNNFLSNSVIKEINIPKLETIMGSNFLYNNTKLKKIELPVLKNIGSSATQICRDSYLLKYVNLSSIISWEGNDWSRFTYAVFITLPIDFDFDGLNLTGSTIKSYEWLNVELPTKLKDNSGGTAKTLTIGSANIALITPANQAIIANKNWTLL